MIVLHIHCFQNSTFASCFLPPFEGIRGLFYDFAKASGKKGNVTGHFSPIYHFSSFMRKNRECSLPDIIIYYDVRVKSSSSAALYPSAKIVR